MSDSMPIEYPETIEKPPNWMRCMVIRTKNKGHIANGVIFHDGTVVIRNFNGMTMTFPDAESCEKTFDPGVTLQHQDVRIEPYE